MSIMYPDRVVGTFNACRALSRREVEDLERMGIPPDALAGPLPVLASHVHFDGDRFEFEHHHLRQGAVPAYLFLVTNRWDEAIDIVAWSPSFDMLATWLSRAWALGEETIYAPRFTEHGGLPVHRSPAAWLRAYREGIVIVRPSAAAHYLDDAGPLLAEGDDHGEELDEILTRPKPRILVPSPHASH